MNGVKTYFVYADEGLVAEVDAAGNVTKSYGYKPGSTWTTDPLFMKVGGQYYFYQNDHLGTPQKLTAVNGATVWSAKYSSFGEAAIKLSSTVINNLRFPGQYFDFETGLHYNWHRYYAPSVGRYIRPDPYRAGMNFYEYCYGNPNIYLDPYGLDAHSRWIKWLKDGAYRRNGEWRRKHTSREYEQQALPYTDRFLTALYKLETEGINVDNLPDEVLDELYREVRDYYREAVGMMTSMACLTRIVRNRAIQGSAPKSGLTRLKNTVTSEDLAALKNIHKQARGETPLSDLYKPVSQGGAVRKISGTGQATRTHIYKFNRTGDKVKIEIWEVSHTGGKSIKIFNETIPASESPLLLESGESFTHVLAQP